MVNGVKGAKPSGSLNIRRKLDHIQQFFSGPREGLWIILVSSKKKMMIFTSSGDLGALWFTSSLITCYFSWPAD